MRLTEYVNNVSSKIEGNVMEGVLVLGPSSKNKRKYTKSCMNNGCMMYDNAAVYIDHQDKGPRKLSERFGRLKNPRVTPEGIRADLHFLSSHPNTKVIQEDVEASSGMFGLSHNVQAECHRTKEGLTVTAINSVNSCDIVSSPATTKSLFEQQLLENNFEEISEEEEVVEEVEKTEQEAPVVPEEKDTSEMDTAIEGVVLAILRDDSLDLQGKLDKIKIALENGEELETEEDNPKDKEEETTEQHVLELADVKNQLSEIKKQLAENTYIRPRTQGVGSSDVTLDLKTLGAKIRGDQ